LEQRERELLIANETEWTAPLRQLDIQGSRFRKGFVECVTMRVDALLANAEAIRSLAPIRELTLLSSSLPPNEARLQVMIAVAHLPLLEQITSLDLAQLDHQFDHLDALLTSPRLVRLTRLVLRRSQALFGWVASAPFVRRLERLRLVPYGSDNAGWFFRNAELSSLTRLDLSAWAFTGNEIGALVDSPWLAKLEELALAQLQLSPPDLQVLGRAYWQHLHRLDLTGAQLTPELLNELLTGPLVRRVAQLGLSGNRLGAEGAERLARDRHLGGLRRLSLNANRIGPGGAWWLARARGLQSLESLSLRTNRIGDDGLAHLAHSDALPALRELSLAYNGITSRGLLDLATSNSLRLEMLDLSWNRFGDAGVLALASSPHLTTLTALDLGYNELTDRAAIALAQWPSLSNLDTLELSTNRIGDAGLAALAESPHLGRLTALHLSNTAVGDAGAAALLDSPLLSRMEVLTLSGSRVSPSMRDQLRRRFRGILG
jgi:hypothetical protein